MIYKLGKINWKEQFLKLDEECAVLHRRNLDDQLRKIIITAVIEEDNCHKLENMAVMVTTIHGKRLVITNDGYDVVEKEVSR